MKWNIQQIETVIAKRGKQKRYLITHSQQSHHHNKMNPTKNNTFYSLYSSRIIFACYSTSIPYSNNLFLHYLQFNFQAIASQIVSPDKNIAPTLSRQKLLFLIRYISYILNLNHIIRIRRNKDESFPVFWLGEQVRKQQQLNSRNVISKDSIDLKFECISHRIIKISF